MSIFNTDLEWLIYITLLFIVIYIGYNIYKFVKDLLSIETQLIRSMSLYDNLYKKKLKMKEVGEEGLEELDYMLDIIASDIMKKKEALSLKEKYIIEIREEKQL